MLMRTPLSCSSLISRLVLLCFERFLVLTAVRSAPLLELACSWPAHVQPPHHLLCVVQPVPCRVAASFPPFSPTPCAARCPPSFLHPLCLTLAAAAPPVVTATFAASSRRSECCLPLMHEACRCKNDLVVSTRRVCPEIGVRLSFNRAAYLLLF